MSNDLKPLPLALPAMLGLGAVPSGLQVGLAVPIPNTAPPALDVEAAPHAEVDPLSPQGDRVLKRIPRTNLKAMTVKFLKDQGGLCPLCNKPIDLRIPREGVVDHDHNTGEVRGVLHRGCNGAEGKVANSVGRWAGTGMDYARIIPWLENLLAYLKREGTGYMYPTHKTPEEKKAATKQKAKRAKAQTVARAKVRSMKKES